MFILFLFASFSSSILSESSFCHILFCSFTLIRRENFTALIRKNKTRQYNVNRLLIACNFDIGGFALFNYCVLLVMSLSANQAGHLFTVLLSDEAKHRETVRSTTIAFTVEVRRIHIMEHWMKLLVVFLTC